MIYPDLRDYIKMSEGYNIVPVYTDLLVDMDTPISIFKKVCSGENAFLLESVEGGEHLARYSFIGFDPFLSFMYQNGTGEITNSGNNCRVKGDPLEVLGEIMARYSAPRLDGLPRFYGGAVGYFGYDMIRYFEDIPSSTADDLNLPECWFILTKIVLIFDHVKHKLKIVVNTEPGLTPAEAFNKAVRRIEEIKSLVGKPFFPRNATQRNITEPPSADIVSNVTKEEFIEKVNRAKEYIKEGDIFQVVLSQRLKMPLTEAPFDIYRNLRTINPAPYLFYLDFGKTVIIGSSPEMLVRVEDNIVQTCPIAGTRPRGKNKDEDLYLENELLADAKEKAEHLMLVDLGRNDLGRVCECGSIELKSFMEVQRYSHVMHLVSMLAGVLNKSKNFYDALKSCFPAGTVSGAPKLRAMEIIEELEPVRRGVYAGAIGYLGFAGNMDTCITIRTILVHEGTTYVQAGAGIVADSDPEREYEETINKAKALLKTLVLREVV